MTPLNNKTILVVDDEDLLREALSELLTVNGATVLTAENGTIALEMAKKNHFDAIISDQRMPGGDGLELAKQIKAQISPAPKFFLCSGMNDLTEEESQLMGVSRVFPKPFDFDAMIKTVSSLLGSS